MNTALNSFVYAYANILLHTIVCNIEYKYLSD